MRRPATEHQALPSAGQEGKEAAAVRAMFDRVAARYDLTNTVVSFGQDAGWRRVAARAAQPIGAAVLDVGAGTGGLSRALVRQGAAEVVALDLSWNMLAAGRRRPAVRVRWVAGDALRLPFGDATFDVATVAFALRNLPGLSAGLAEIQRVTRPGGRLVVLEFSTPTRPLFQRVYRDYLVRGLPSAARLVSSAPAAYRYLADSILAWPDQHELGRLLRAAGWYEVEFRNLSGGIVAVHRARRPLATLPGKREEAR